MIKSKISAVVVAVGLALAAAGSANAFIISAGDFKISVDNYDSGTTGYGNAAGVKCLNSTAGCDAVAGISLAPGSVGSTNTSADTMGIFSVLSVTRISNNQAMFTRGVDGYLTGVFGNLVDRTVDVQCGVTGCNTTALAQGGTFAIYQNAADYNSTFGPFVTADVDLNDARYKSITDTGSLYLQGIFAAGVIAGDTTTTYLTQYNNATTSGGGQGFVDLTGGSALAQFNTNAQCNLLDPGAPCHDLYLSTTFFTSPLASANGWTVVSTSQLTGNAIPEPGSLALVALAMLGVGAATRRRKV